MGATLQKVERGKLVVGVGDLKLCGDSGQRIVTFALGSCIGVTVYDPTRRVGGLLHAMLPRAEAALHEKANPAMFVDLGIPDLFRGCYELGATKEDLIVCVAGGASRMQTSGGDMFKIGERNVEMARELLAVNNVIVHAWDVGGTGARTLTLDLADGAVRVRTALDETRLT